MRRRPQLVLFLKPQSLLPGELAAVTLRMISKSDTPCSEVSLQLVGTERRYAYTSGKQPIYHHHDIVRLQARFDGFRLTEGAHERRANFAIPPNAPPTYESHLTTIRYELTARVVIPWWPDRHATYRLPVVLPPIAGAPPRGATRYTSGPAPMGKALFIEASLAREDIAIGSKVEGVVSMANVAHHRIRGVQAALIEIESSRVKSVAGPSETRRTTWTLLDKKPEESAEIRFALKIPDALWPDFVTPLIAVTHELRIIAQISLGSDIHIAIPIRLHRPRLDIAEAQATPALLGRGKRKSNWSRALADFGNAVRIVSLDEETDELVVDHDRRSIHMTAEHRGALGPFLVAEIEWPPLGMGLKVAERSWTDLGRKKAVDALDERFTIEARDPEQAKALFANPMTQACIAAFRSIGIDDSHGVAASPGSSHAAAALKEMLAHAIALSDAMVNASNGIPPPKGLERAAQAYRSFAERYGARLVPGDFSIRRFSLDGVTFSIEHSFADATPTSSMVTAFADVPEERQNELRDRVTKVAPSAVMSGSNIAITLPLLTDPSSVAPMLDGLAEAIRSIADKDRPQGPYR